MGDNPDISSSNGVNGVALDTDVQCLKNGDVDHGISEMLSDGVVKKMADNDHGNDSDDTGQQDEPVPPHIITSPSVHREDDGNLNSEVGDCVNDDVGSDSDHDIELSHSVSDKQQSNVEAEHADADDGDGKQCLDWTADLDGDVSMGVDCSEITMQNSTADGGGNSESQNAETNDPISPQKSASCATVPIKAESANVTVMDCSEMQNSAADGDNGDESQHAVKNDPSSPQKSASSATIKTESADMAAGITCSEMQNPSADADGDNDDKSQHAVTSDPICPQKSALSAVSETESADSDLENSGVKDLPTSKPGENNADADKSHVAATGELQLECNSDEVKTEPANAESASSVAPASVELKCETTGEYSINSSSPSTSCVSSAGGVTSSATSLCTIATVVISTPALSSSSASGLLSKVAILSVPPGTAVSRPTQQSSKPVTVSVPSTTGVNSGTVTRQMSKVLQDVGLLLVSERVFKNLAVIQEQKLADNPRQCDVDLLQKLKTSHQNLVAKNHGLLMPSRKCWCGFQSESANVIEAHRLSCDLSRCCCYCQAGPVYRSQKQMKQHLWKVHKKIGNIDYRLGGNYMCPFCPLDFAAYVTLNNHMEVCRRKFWLASNLAPREHDKDIPVTTAVKQPVKIPVLASSSHMRPAGVSRNSSASTSVSAATRVSSAIVPPRVGVQLPAAARSSVPVPHFIQLGKQLYPILPSSTTAAPMIAVNRSSVSVSKVALNSAVQSVQSAKPPLPIIVNSRSLNPLAAVRPATVPTPLLQCGSQFTRCSVCGAFVKDKTALLVHMHIAHGATHKLCQYCCSPDITFSSVAELHRHIAKFHTSDCWICKASFQPADCLINHIAERHKVTIFKMLELRRCYLCSSVPSFSNYSAFEEHMIKLHPLQFPDIGKLWDRIIWSPNADRNWYAKQNPDSTLECPLCFGQFISTSFIYRHFHLQHNGRVVRFVNCPQCVKRMPSNILQDHLIAAHTRKCSVQLVQVDVPDDGCVFVPPVGTKRLKNRRGERVLSSCPRLLKRVKTVETVIVCDSDNDDSDNNDDDSSYDEETHDDTNDKDFVMSSRVKLQPTPLQLRSTRSRVDQRNSSTDDVHEVLESIVYSGESETIVRRSIGYLSTNTSIRSSPVGTAAATQFVSGITEDEVEIIDSIVPRVCSRPVQPGPRHYKPASAAGAQSTKSRSVDLNGGGDVELVEHNGDCQRPSAKLQSSLMASSAENLMERNQITSNSVEEVMEVDGETLLIVHDDDSDDDDSEPD